MELALNEAQREAVETTEGNVRVIAGAGSGKTRTLAARYAFLVNDLGILPENILSVSFTNKSAEEMRRRIRRLCGDQDTGFITTFHGFCAGVLKEEANAIAFPKNFLVMDNGDIDALLEIIYEERGLSLRHMSFKDARDYFEIRKIQKEPEYVEYICDLRLDELKQKYDKARSLEDILFYGYLYHARKSYALDYNDLILLTLHIFKNRPEIAQRWQERLEYILIDEFQDIDALQYELMDVLAGFHHNLFIVGDPDQTIYTWRGASVRWLLDFDKVHPETKTIFLNQNYRSTPQILEAANSLIEKNVNRLPKELFTSEISGLVPKVHLAKDPQKEALWIAEQIEKLMKQGYAYNDIAILYRAHYLSRSIEEALLARQIPYTMYSGAPFFERKEIKDALSWLHMLYDKSDLALRRTINEPKRGIGRTRMQFLSEQADATGKTLWQTLLDHLDDPRFASTGAADYVALIESESEKAKSMSISDLLGDILSRSGYEKMLRTMGAQERLDNLAELKQAVQEFESSAGEEAGLEQYLSHAAFYTNADLDFRREAVRLMSVHTAKGLEFPVVFLAGLSENIFPSRRVKKREEMEEERRLAFVAMTRAQKRLFLSAGGGDATGGAFRVPSRFLLEINPPALDFDPPLPENERIDAEGFIRANEQMMEIMEKKPDLQPGDRIEHPVFGPGDILETARDGQFYLIRFDKLKTERKISRKAKLKKIGHADTGRLS